MATSKPTGTDAMPAHKKNAFGGDIAPTKKETPAPAKPAGKEG